MIPPFLFSKTRRIVSQALSFQVEAGQSDGDLKCR